MQRCISVCILAIFVISNAICFAQDEAPQVRGPRPRDERVKNGVLTPHWFAEGKKFWYRKDLEGSAREFVLVDAVSGTKAPAFDHAKLAESLAKATESEIKATELPLEGLEFVADKNAIRFGVKGTRWECDLASYAISKTDAPAPPTTETQDQGRSGPLGRGRGQGRGQRGFGEVPTSPDGQWTAFVKEFNLFVRSKEGKEFSLTTDGKEGLAYGLPRWAPDSQSLMAWRIEPGQDGQVHLIASSPREGGRATLQTRGYPLPGDKFTAYEPYLFKRKSEAPEGESPFAAQKIETDKVDFGFPFARWREDSKAFRYTKIDRGHQRYRLIEVSAETGLARNIIDERTETFIWTMHTETLDLQLLNPLEKSDEYIYVSEVDGWRHLYLIVGSSLAEGDAPAVASPGKQLFSNVKSRITSGEYVIRGIDRIDEEARQIWFRAGGKHAGEDPYFVHYYRVNFDGTGLVALTEGNGQHSVAYSPTREFLIDSYSRVDAPPSHSLRRVSDGGLVCKLEDADISQLERSGFRAPEVFVAKGRDGQTDIWGIIQRPKDFDPTKKYPVIEDIYAGPQSAFVPKTFSSFNRWTDLTDLGFIVVKIDGMGTAFRSKAFHDVCFKNLKDAGFPDRIAWMKAAAAKYPEMDITRVGVYGTSAGGQNAGGAVLFHPEFYKVAVASCGCHDNRMDKSSWNEQWMCYPVGPQYAESSNIDNAHRLQGKLHLMVGELDTNVPPESTMRFVDALIKAGKDFELLVVPGAGHSNGGAYGTRRRNDFFVRHLLNREPPDRNAPRSAGRTQSTAATNTTVAAQVISPTTPATENNVASPPSAKPIALPEVIAPPPAFFEMVPEKHREAAKTFYAKYIEVQGLPVVAASEVDDRALTRTYEIVRGLLAGRPDILEAMVKNRMYLIIIGKNQVYTQMPEYSDSPNPEYMNERVRGTGGRPTSFGEENLLCLSSDRYDDESIGVHEFCHTIDGALGSIDKEWRQKKNATFRAAMDKGLWKDSYAASNAGEYWAEICQSYFDCNRVNNWNHGPIGTREQLKAYDPEGYELVSKIFNLTPEIDWRYSYLKPMPAVEPPPASWNANSFYTKSTAAREFRILGRGATDEALLKANHTIRGMFAYRHDIIKALMANGVRLVVLGKNEKLSDLPEIAALPKESTVDSVTRTLNYLPEIKLLVVDETNLLSSPGEKMIGDSQIVQVMADAAYQVCGKRPADPNWENRGRDVQQYELRVKRLDESFDKKLGDLYEAAKTAGKWKRTPAVHDKAAYWSQGVLLYFNATGQSPSPTDAAYPIRAREDLKSYDGGLFDLVEETMAFKGRVDWRLE
jgi:dipeptidyl aminopeptidase/acylaminoacyl peptidase